eukprot:911035-Prymnesium_polylepis.2
MSRLGCLIICIRVGYTHKHSTLSCDMSLARPRLRPQRGAGKRSLHTAHGGFGFSSAEDGPARQPHSWKQFVPKS